MESRENSVTALDDSFLGVLYRCAGLEKVSMTGCCLYCRFAESYWIDREGKRHVPPKTSFGDMNIFCHQPKKGAGIECYPISFTRCSVFERDNDERIQRRIKFFSQFPRFKAHAEMIAQRP